MSDSQTLTLNLDVAELMIEFLPKMAKEMMSLTDAAKDLEGAKMSIVVEISGQKFSYVLNGADLEAKTGDLDAPQVRLSIGLEDMQRLVVMKNIDLVLGAPKDGLAQAKEKQAAFEQIKGSLGVELTNDDESVSKFTVVLNNSGEPKALFKLSMENVRQLASGDANPVSMFMSGGIQIEGDIGFAMTLQPLLL